MYAKETIIINKTGLHARPASEFTKQATGFQSDITIVNLDSGKEGNAKSIIAVMAMALSKDTKIQIRAEGEDQEAAVEALVTLIDGGFGEV
ncbi:HPr family phosphocarrier protein [Eubacterium aggregans]|uniref:HPr family phosphocarrier protein n=1 Tax=Eubacterium aggregans TaxID=81409 RepID=UPI0023F0C0C0|nr:HPr family phosphocarrier protein [Eubacterium aggregans]MDD4692321.1 HPr family phosphocarrier protein [Eubacterium aggregans]